MAVTDPIYEIVDHQELGGRSIVNVYHYIRQGGVVVPAASLADAYRSQILPLIAARQTPLLSHRKVTARNLFDVTDYAEQLINVPGTAGTSTDEILPIFVSVTVNMGPGSKITRPGRKGVAGLREVDHVNGVLNPTVTAAWTALANRMVEGLKDTALQVVTWALPVIVKRILTPAGTYRLPATFAEAVINTVPSATVSPFVSTVNSRKA